MDQNFEAVLSMAVFILVFSTANYVCIATYAGSITAKLDCTLSHYASIAGDAIVIEQSTGDGWGSFTPSCNASLYGIPDSVSLWVNARCVSIAGLCEPVTVWTKASSQPPAFRAGECVKMVEIGGGLAVIITVRAW